MSVHTLFQRSEKEVLWTQRREVIAGAASWVALGGFGAAYAQQRSNIVQLTGDALLNGARLNPQTVIQTGDRIETGPRSELIFVVGNASFHVRQNSRISVERGETLNAVSLLRLLTGAVVSVWGKGSSRRIVTPTLTAGIRGTGVYTEVFPERNNRSYFCNCYGTVDVSAGSNQVVSEASYHQAFWAEAAPVNGRSLQPAGAINHTDEELEFLARLIEQRTAWQAMGKKGIKDGKGMMENSGDKKHPATTYY